MKNLIFICTLFLFITSCKSTKDTTEDKITEGTTNQRNHSKRGQGNIDDLFNSMDTNKDGKLTQLEVKGPLAENFNEIDTNSDSVLSKEELKNAPKPERGERGQRPRRN